jgi:hypothetical protein
LIVVRRYLSLAEAEATLRRGKSVECFLGRCERDGQSGIRWLSFRGNAKTVQVSVFETADQGGEGMLDLYEFGPLDSSRELDEADEELHFTDFAEAIAELNTRFPVVSTKLVNEGVVQNEYADFIARGRRDA